MPRLDSWKLNLIYSAWLIVMLIPLILLFSGCSSKNESASAAMQAMPVEFYTVQTQTYQDSTELMAQVDGKHSTDIHAQVPGRIVRVLVMDGQLVQQGQALYQLDISQQAANVRSLTAVRDASLQQPAMYQKTIEGLKADLLAAQTELNFNKKQLLRYQELVKDNTVSEQDTEQYQTTVSALEQKAKSIQANIASQQARYKEAVANVGRDNAALQSASANLSYFTVRAPFTGTIGTLIAKQGDVIDPMTVLTTLTDNRNLEIDVAVSADDRGRIYMGMPMQLLNMQNQQLGEVKTTYIAPKVDAATQTFLLKGKLINTQDNLAMDQHMRVRLIWGDKEAAMIPLVSVFRMDGVPFVYRASKDKKAGTVAHMQALTVGPIVGENIAVFEGLKPGDVIIKSGIQKLQEGVPVAELPPESSQKKPH